MGTLHGVLSMVGDDNTRKILDNFKAAGGGQKLRTVDEILYGGHGYNFFRTVEGAKIDLSSHNKAAVRFVRPHVDVNESIARSEFTKLIGPDLDRIDGTIDKALADAGVTPGEVKAVVRTGGSSQIPAFVSRVNDRFGPGKVEERDALATVALGLGLIALETFG